VALVVVVVPLGQAMLAALERLTKVLLVVTQQAVAVELPLLGRVEMVVQVLAELGNPQTLLVQMGLELVGEVAVALTSVLVELEVVVLLVLKGLHL
jgi:hypothetical protein